MSFFSNEKTFFRLSLLIGIIFLLIHFAIALIFHQERLAHGDNCFYVFKLIHFQSILCENHRFSVFLFQWIPWLALKAGASISLLMKVYSGSFIVFFLVVLLITALVFKNHKGSIAMLFFMFLALRRDFFMPVAEYQQAYFISFALCSTFFTGIFSSHKKAMIFAFAIVAISLNFHYVSLLGIAYLFVFDSLYYNEFKLKKVIVPVLAFIVIIIILKQIVLPLSGYEQTKMPSIKNVTYYFLHPSEIPGLKTMLDYFLSVMPASFIIAAAALTLNIFKRKWLIFLLDLLFIYSSAILLSVIRGTGDDKIWSEGYGLLLFFPAAVSLSYHLTDMKKYKVLLPIALALCGILSVHGILGNYHYFHLQIKYAQRLIERGHAEKEKKYIISNSNVPGLYVDNKWPIPFQTLLLSSLNSPDSSITVFATDQPDKYDDLVKDPKFFLGPEWGLGTFNIPGWRIRKQYFNLPELGYLKLNTHAEYSTGDTAYFNKEKIAIQPLHDMYYSGPDSFLVVEVRIKNESGKKISSFTRQDTATFLSYHLYTELGDSLLRWDNWRTALETDINKFSLNGLNIYTKDLPEGHYTIEVDLLTEHVRWWGINSRFRLIVK